MRHISFVGSTLFVGALIAALVFDVVQLYRQSIPAGQGIALYAADQGLKAYIESERTTLQVGHSTVSLYLAAYRAGTRSFTLQAAHPTLWGDRISLNYGHGLSAWYAKRGTGIEQGFSLRHPPDPHAAKIMLVFDIRGTLRPHLLNHQVLEFIGAHDKPLIRYANLFAYDAGHRWLPARMTLAGNRLVLEVDTRRARYPVTVDPTATVETVFTDPDDRVGDNFGMYVALSADGSTALIDASSAMLNGTCIGKAYVYTQVNGAWSTTPAAVFNNPDTTTGQCAFGESAALSADGSIVLIGAPTIPFYPTNNDRAYIYTRTGGVWSLTPVATFMNPDANDKDCFSCSVALSSDGATALIGAQGTTINGAESAGAVYIFTHSNGTWSATPAWTFTDPGAVKSDEFGCSIALSGDGTAALIGANQLFSKLNGVTGRVFVFTATNGAWSPTPDATFADPDYTGSLDNFGASVALSTAGTIALVGAMYANNSAGRAYIYTLEGTTWSPVPSAVFDNPDLASGEYFGGSVALSGDGSTALIDAFSSDAAYVFTQVDGLWGMTPAATLVPDKVYSTTSVALSSTGTIALIGAPQSPGASPPPPPPGGVPPNETPGLAYAYENTSGWSSPPADTPPPSPGGSGGGSLGWLSVIVLLGPLIGRRYSAGFRKVE